MDVRFEVVENPTRVGVPEAFEGAMGIFLFVRVGVVLDMGGGPVKGGALHGHGTADEEEGFQPRMSLETFVGKHPVVADGDAVTTKGEKGKEQSEIDPGDIRVPEKNNSGDHPEDGEPDEGEEDGFSKRIGCLSVGDG